MDALDREFLPAALEIFETPPSPIGVAGIWLICIVFAGGLAWSYFGWLEIYAVAQGRIQPNGRSKVVQPLEAGKVVAIGVENGSHVAAGDLLAELDPRETAADRDQQARDLESTLAEAARRRIAILAARPGNTGTPQVIFPENTSEEVRKRENGVLASDLAQLLSNRASLMAQRAERTATSERLRGSIAARQKLLALAKEHVDMLETLNLTKSASRAQVIEKLQQYEAQVTAQISDQGQSGEVEASMLTLDRKLEETTAQFIADQTQKLEEADRRADHLKGEVIKATTRHERTRLTAPISGTVQQLAVTTVGQVVASGQALMTIVPSDGPIEIEAMIQNQDIGFVEPGQAVVVKVESFPFTRFGTIDGTVVKVSRDAVDEREETALNDPKSTVRPQASTTTTAPQSRGQNLVFPATISLSRRFITIEGKEIPLSPGMAVTVEIRTGQRRALDYVLSPLREVTSSAGHER
jgi:hemolysin D